MTTMASRYYKELDDADDFGIDRLPGMPMLGFLAGTVLGLGLWGAVWVIAWRLIS